MTNKISVWIVLNAKGQYLGFNYVTKAYEFMKTSKGDTFSHESLANDLANMYGGHVVELVEKAEPVEVSGGAGELLTYLRESMASGDTTHISSYYVDVLNNKYDMPIEDIFRALDVGWTVKQPKRWYVKVPKEWDDRGERQRFYKRDDNSIGQATERFADNSNDEQFTAEEIDKYHLNEFEKVEVTDHD